MRLFISYAHVDKFQVSQLVDVLREADYDPWFDHKLMPGHDWKAELYKAIERCDAFLYALTPESVQSEWCQWEFGQAVHLGKPVIPVLMQSKTDLPPAIAHLQYVDFTEGPTPKSVARLLGGLRLVTAVI
ncbi:MAG: toll/interleukin-1 receptor domain-containing protein, partial [Anaerolineae bacterium]|nr:toll/interleukin-1 receptor domain-containing protein [Anaerolineae bacterium]